MYLETGFARGSALGHPGSKEIRRIVDWKRTGAHAWVQFLHPIRIIYVMYTRHHARKEEVVENDSDAQLRVDIACAEHSQRHANDLFMRTAL